MDGAGRKAIPPLVGPSRAAHRSQMKLEVTALRILRLIAAYDQLAATLNELRSQIASCHELLTPSSEQSARMARAYRTIAVLGSAVATMAGLLDSDIEKGVGMNDHTASTDR